MYVKQFWKCFEQSGDINTYIRLKEYEKLYMEHTQLDAMQSMQESDTGDVDRMS